MFGAHDKSFPILPWESATCGYVRREIFYFQRRFTAFAASSAAAVSGGGGGYSSMPSPAERQSIERDPSAKRRDEERSSQLSAHAVKHAPKGRGVKDFTAHFP